MSQTASTDGLLAALRQHTGIEHLAWATPPEPLTGGFWAEMYIVELADPPTPLAGRLVARIMPDPSIAAFETAVHRHVHGCGVPVPAVRAASGPTTELDRAWVLMDLAPGRPLLSGLSATSVIGQAPTLIRRLPDLLAEAAARLHRCPVDGIDVADHAGVGAFLERIAAQARLIERPDLAATAERLAAQAPARQVLCHGDLHPFNLLVDHGRWTLIDWSAAVIADPHYDLAFTTLMLANPPLGGPAPVRAAARALGKRIADRFLRTYADHSGNVIDDDLLGWGRSVHSLRAVVELSTWESQDRLDAHRGHPWIALRPTFEAQLSSVVA